MRESSVHKQQELLHKCQDIIKEIGFSCGFLSHVAIGGIMAGAAILIGLQQMKGLLAITNFTTKTDVVSVVESAVKYVHQPVARFIGRRNKKLFWVSAIAPLISVILSTLMLIAVSYR